MKIKSITFITLLLALIFFCSPIVAFAANNADSLGVPVVSGEFIPHEKYDYASSVKLTWTKVSKATSYRIYRASSSMGEKIYLGETENLFYGDLPKWEVQTPNVDTFYYYVTAINKNTGVEGEYSKACKVNINSEQYSSVKYSDLFWVYDSSYLDNPYINDYSDEVYFMLLDVQTSYVENPLLGLTSELKTAIHASTNWVDWCKIVSDKVLGTGFQQNAAYDAANLQFAQNLLSEQWLNTASSELSNFADGAKKVSDFVDNMSLDMDIRYMTTDDIYVVLCSELSNKNLVAHLGNGAVEKAKNIPVSNYLKGGAKYGSEALTIAKSLVAGLLIENLRMEMIDNIIASAPTGYAIYQGMTRLKSQLRNGFQSYFLDTYVKDKVIDTFAEKAIEGIFSGDFILAKKALSAVSFIITDVVLFAMPDVDDILTYATLMEYSNDMNKLLKVYQDRFDVQFSVEDVENYALLFSAFTAINNAALNKAKDFDRASNRDELAAVITKSAKVSYEGYIDSVKDDISDQNSSDRKRKTYETWTINGDVKFSYASDTLEKNTIYLRSSTFCCDNTILKGTCTIEEGASVFIDGNLEISSGSLTISENSTFEVGGDTKIYYRSYNGSGDIYNNGVFETNSLNCSEHGYYHQTSADAQLIINGDFSAYSTSCCDIANGVVTFDGTSDQTIKNLKAYNLDVWSWGEIKYLSDIYVYGNYNLNGNPLDNNGKYTRLYDGATLSDGSNYKDVYIDSDFTLRSNLPCDKVVICETFNVVDGVYDISGDLYITPRSAYHPQFNVTINKDASLKICGLLKISGNSCLNNEGYMEVAQLSIHEGILNILKDGKFVVNGDIDVEGYSSSYGGTNGHIYNSGILETHSLDVNNLGNYHQTETEAQLILSGNVYFYQGTSCDISAGTIIFNGTEQQTLNGVTAYNIEVLNPSGIKYASAITLYGNYNLNGYTLDNNGYSTVIHNGATFADDSDYKYVSVPQDTEFTILSDINCDTLSVGGTLNALTGSSYTIYGNMVVSQKGVVEISKDASLLIDGNVRAYGSSSAYGGGGDGRIKNNGTLTVNDLTIDAYGYYTQNEKSAILNVLGNLKFYYNPNITAGTIVFKGEEQQTVNGLRAFNIDVLNPKGIKYLSSIDVYGTYDLHGNPLDVGSYKTNFYENGLYGTLECNQSDWIIDENPSCGKAGSKHIECLICHEIVKQEEIPISTDHSWIFVSCETARICEVCGAVEDASPGHSFGDYVSNNDATYTVNGTKTAKCDRCDQTDTVTDEESALGLDQKFKDEFAVLTNDADTETTYSELYALLQTYATLSDEEKANVATEFITVQQMINAYNEKAHTANSELADATEIAFAPIVATGFTFLAVLWFLLKKKFFI